MDSQITAIYCVCDDVLKTLHHYEEPQRQMTDAEVMTMAVVFIEPIQRPTLHLVVEGLG